MRGQANVGCEKFADDYLEQMAGKRKKKNWFAAGETNQHPAANRKRIEMRTK